MVVNNFIIKGMMDKVAIAEKLVIFFTTLYDLHGKKLH